MGEPQLLLLRRRLRLLTPDPDPESTCGRFSLQEPVLRYGATGPAVRALQCEPSSAIYGIGLEFDGIFGQKTYDAVIKFQGRECANIDVDGVVGPITWAQLDRWNNNAHFAC